MAQGSPGAPPPLAALPGGSSAPTPAVIELSEHNFAATIDGHPFAVIGIGAPSSAPSRAFASSFAAAAARNPDALFAKVDADTQRAVVEQLEITSLPTLIIFRSNIIVYAKAGMLQAEELDQVVEHCARARHAGGAAQGRQRRPGRHRRPPALPARRPPNAGPTADDRLLSIETPSASIGPRSVDAESVRGSLQEGWSRSGTPSIRISPSGCTAASTPARPGDCTKATRSISTITITTSTSSASFRRTSPGVPGYSTRRRPSSGSRG